MKRRKLVLVSELPVYHSFTSGNLNGLEGFYYHLSEPLEVAEDLRIRKTYNNVIVCHSTKEYAPEIQSSVLFVANKVIK